MSFTSQLSTSTQVHGEILEIDVPVITGTCTLEDGSNGFGTPLSCTETWTGEYETLKFTNVNSQIFGISGIHRCISSISEQTPKLKSGKGLASKGSLNITFVDFVGDPNPDAPGVSRSVELQGTYFGKLYARQIMANKSVRLKCYRATWSSNFNQYTYPERSDIVPYPYDDEDFEIRYYIVEKLVNNGNGTWTLQCKDELSVTNEDERVWPISYGGYLRQDIDDSSGTQDIPVDPVVDYQGLIDNSEFGDIYIRIGDEFMKANAVTDNQGPNATLHVNARFGFLLANDLTTITRTVVDEHSAGDEIFVCSASESERVDDLLYKMLTESGIDPSYIPTTDWANEVDTWLPGVTVTTLWSESDDLSNQINTVLKSYMLDMWFDPVAREVKLSAVSVWKESSATLTEDKEIRYGTMRITPQESLRASRALVVYNKAFLAESNDVANYTRASRYSDTDIVQEQFYGDDKDVTFEPSNILDSSSADALVKRTVERFKIQPSQYSWVTDEAYRTFNTGDVVNIVSSQIQYFDGTFKDVIKRAQITSVIPQYRDGSREYRVTALTYEVTAQSGDNYLVTSVPYSETFDIYEFVGKPATAVELNIVFDAATFGSDSNSFPAISAGDFPAGSKLNIILINGSLMSAKGGDGGDGGDIFVNPTSPNIFTLGNGDDGGAGGTVFDVNGIDCDFYLSGATGNAQYPTADGYLFAPSGGNGGSGAFYEYEPGPPPGQSGNGGNGGDGSSVGNGGSAGTASGYATPGTSGSDGDDTTSGTFGVDGSAGADFSSAGGAGGLKGKGVVDTVGGATVNFLIDAGEVITDRYINGGGDFP